MIKSLLPVLAVLGLGTMASFAGVSPVNSSVQIFKGTIKTKFEKLEAGLSQKGSDSLIVYYVQSRSEGAEKLLVINPANKVFFIENEGAATFTLANNNKDLFNLRSSDLRGLDSGTGSLVGKVATGAFAGTTIDFFTPNLSYQFESFGPAPGALYLATHDKATLKIDKAMMKRAYEGGATTVFAALNEVIDFLGSKGYVGLP